MSRVYDLLETSKSPPMALTVPSGIYHPVDITAKLYLYVLASTATFSCETYRLVHIHFSHPIFSAYRVTLLTVARIISDVLPINPHKVM